MKKLFCYVCMLFVFVQTYGQTIDELKADPIDISYDKTLHLVFPTEVKYCSVGNDNILAEKVAVQPNIVRVMAAERGFVGETNLSIVTADTKFYSYEVSYRDLDTESYKKIGQKYEEPHVLPVGKDKLMNLIFPDKIIYENHGNDEVLVAKAQGVDNILTVKAVKPFYRDTNISVVTEKGMFYTFSLRFALNPEIFSFVIDKKEQTKVAILDEGEVNTLRKDQIYKAIRNRPMIPSKLRDRNAGMEFEINNIFIDDNLLLFRLSLNNMTQINYTIDFMRFYIQDAKKRKKTAIQQIEQEILFTFDMPDEIKAHERKMFTVALNKFTIPDKKRLIIEIQEKNGGRHFFFKVKNNHVLKAEGVYQTDVERKIEASAENILENTKR